MLPEIPILMEQYRALLEILPEQHPEYPNMLTYYRRQEAGRKGEDSLCYYLEQAQVPSLHLLNGLRLEHPSSFQLDWLVLGLGFRAIFEVKSHTGEIYFDAKSHQLTRTIAGVTEGFDDPLLQVDRQYAKMRTFLSDHVIYQLPTYRFVVFVNRNVILRLHDYPEYKRVLTAQQVPSILEALAEQHPPVISEEANQAIAHFLVNNHRERMASILEKHHILWDDLIKGVPCPNCSRRSMNRTRMRWQCEYCDTRSTDAHLPVLYYLALLTGNQLTKRLVQSFLQIESGEATRKLITRAGYVKFGVKKGVYYSHPYILAATKNESGHKSQKSGHKTIESGHKIYKSGHEI
ncbi:nuclease-related domain-containing protein [Gracilibacillus sp. S3-1-1]|uniref:Nuclease-related domain-containing protein n=1 Tax=Gracilibacillus pellucidus TaxID=3095368 RepID=A0ACC6M292_9BACI|nr:nuclease-related domain-containing protein [Gracilibacillus sp. S3-1-1]MDX8045049.1 nuclease-related domain-containing protein [Gracilibacillus sp. S3-1-1]